MSEKLRANSQQLANKFCHSRGFPSRILFDQLHDGTADDCTFGEFADGRELRRG